MKKEMIDFQKWVFSNIINTYWYSIGLIMIGGYSIIILHDSIIDISISIFVIATGSWGLYSRIKRGKKE